MRELEAIRLFLAVAEEEGFARAARRLGMSAAVATRRIAALENSLDTRLLARSTRRVSLTAEGEVYREHALRIIEAVEQSHEALRDIGASPRGRLRITSRSSIGLRIVVPYVAEFRARYPQVTLGLELSDAPVDIVAEGFDIAIAMGHLESSSLVAKTLAVTDSLICASPGYLNRHGRPADPRELKDHECLSLPGADRDEHLEIVQRFDAHRHSDNRADRDQQRESVETTGARRYWYRDGDRLVGS